MSDIAKSIIDRISQHFGQEVADFNKSGSGVNSQAYRFMVDGHKYILRTSAKNDSFLLDKFVSDILPDSLIPVPKTILLDIVGSTYFSVTNFCEGDLMIDLSDQSQTDLTDVYLDVSHKIHSYTLSQKNSGFGPINDQGCGSYHSWHEFLLDQHQTKSDLWPESYFETLQNIKSQNSNNVIKNRSLIHGDYGHKNIITNQGKIGGVIDWSDAKYGDFVYDLAYISFWASATDYLKLFYSYYKQLGVLDMSNFHQRTISCTLFIAISLLNYFASQNDRESFNWIKQKTDNYLGQNSLI